MGLRRDRRLLPLLRRAGPICVMRCWTATAGSRQAGRQDRHRAQVLLQLPSSPAFPAALTTAQHIGPSPINHTSTNKPPPTSA